MCNVLWARRDGRVLADTRVLRMLTTSLVLLSNQMALQRSVDIVANNIANSSTTGFKRESVQFATQVDDASDSATPSDKTFFVYDRATIRDMSPGTTSSTGNPLDLAIQGSGYFEVQTPQGTQYTRNGAFRTDSQGQIVTSTGLPVLSDGGQPITLPDDARDITVSGDGFITAQTGTGSARAQLGKLGVVDFVNNAALTPTSKGLFTTTQLATPITGNPVIQGAIENSNVNAIQEITDLIRIQRAYEQASNFVGQDNTRMLAAIDKLSQTSA